MILGLSTLLIAIFISAVSAYYSILGLTAIFAAAALPVIIMGIALEAGKVMTAIWLHRNWNRAGWLYKLYLLPAIVFLMLLTSMGVFGFLSKAHIEQTVPSSDIQAQVQLIDEKIQTQRDNIELARKTIAQLNATVDETLTRSKTEKGAVNADWIRKTQAKERTALQNDIANAQKEIVKLQEERAPLAAKVRKVEAEVGPIKYVAALMYGDNTDTNLLERAVRWVILLIVVVFDPLAIVLIIAAIKQFEWARSNFRSEPQIKSEPTEAKTEDTNDFVYAGLDGNAFWVPPSVQKLGSESEETKTVLNETITSSNTVFTEEVQQNSEKPVQETNSDHLDSRLAAILQVNQALELEIQNLQAQLNSRSESDQSSELEKYQTLQEELETTVLEKNLLDVLNSELILKDHTQKARITELETEIEILKQQLIKDEPEIIQEPVVELSTEEITQDPESEIDSATRITKTDFGNSFPAAPQRGDMYMRIDFTPKRLFKWNGVKWIEINTSSTDAFSFNQEYIAYLAEKLSSGEYTVDDLSETELEQIQQLLGGANA